MARPKQQTPPAPAARPTAYSYVRFSNPIQAEGDSARRQVELRDAWLARSGAVLDTLLRLRDEGVSAYTGAHRANPDRHALAAFLELVRSGRIPRGSYLIVESLDRLTREHIRPALTLLLNLIDNGIRVVQLLPVEAVYDEAVEPMSLMMAIMELSRGHSESKVKAERLGRAWAEKKRKAAEGVPLTRALPAWVRARGDKLELIPEKAAAVRRVYEMAVAGYGLGAITKRLNAEKVKPIARCEHWARSYVNKLLNNRAVFGEYQPHKGHAGPNRKPDGPPVPNYFPAVVTEDEFHAAQAALKSRRNKGGRPSSETPIFSGLLRDARDGGPVTSLNKGRKGTGAVLVSYRAVQGTPGAKYVAFPRETFEAAVLSRLREIDPKTILPRYDATADRVEVLAGKYAALEARVEKIKAQLIGGGDLAPLVDVLRAVDAERQAVGDELAVARREAASPLSEAWGECRGLLDALESAPDREDARVRLRAAVRRIVESVWCVFADRGRDRYAAVQLWFVGGAHRDYLIAHLGGHGNASAKRRKTWWVRSFAELNPTAGGIDLRRPDHAKKLEKFLSRLDLNSAKL